jgi:hypothetical protein
MKAMLRSLAILTALVCLLVLAGCLTLEAGIERPPTPDHNAIGTLAALYVEGTRWAYHATQIALPPTPTPEVAVIQGRLCYPGQSIPAMQLFFYNPDQDLLEQMGTQPNQETYSVQLAPGEYYAYAWVERFEVGGMYTRAVLCGLDPACTDHSPIRLQAAAGRTINGVDICDWVFPAEELPGPAGRPPTENQPEP